MTLFVQSAAIGDLNHDGFLDILAGHANNFNIPKAENDDDLLINQGNANHFLSVRLTGDSTHVNGIGARLKMVSAIGAQLREIRSGESYGIMNSLNAHFGLGAATMADSLMIFWPSGIKDTLLHLRTDQFLTIHEGIGPCDCDAPQVRYITASSGNGPGSLPFVTNQACPCDTITIHHQLDGDTLHLDERLFAGKDLVFKGLGANQTFINAASGYPALRVQPGTQCMMTDLTFTETAAIPATYLIENVGTITLRRVTFDLPPGVPLKFGSGTVNTEPGTVIVK
jgi:hypothetical protein